MGRVFAVGVGPGSPDFVTETVRKIIVSADIVVGYEYTLKTISNLVQDKKVHTITMGDQEKTYQQWMRRTFSMPLQKGFVRQARPLQNWRS